nr:hypothetical protein [Tanacetum cinerariifolium]
MKESKVYKTYLSYATGTVPPKVAKKFKKASPSKKDSVSVPADEEPFQNGKSVEKSAKKSLTALTTALTKEAQMKEVRKKSFRDFHKSHPSGSCSVAENPPSVEKITPPVTSKGTGDKLGVPDVTKDESTESESESSGNDDDDSNDEEGSERENDSKEHGSDSEQDTDGSESDSESDQQDDDDDEVKDDDEDDDNNDDKYEGDEDRGIDSDDVQDKKADVRMTDTQQEKENLEIIQKQVIKDAHVTITKKTEVHSTPSPQPTTKTTNIPPLILDFASVFRFNDKVIALEKDVSELKNDPLHTQVTALVDDHLDPRIGATREEFMNFLSASLTNRITKQVRNQLPQILPEEVSNFVPPVIEKMIQESLHQILIDKMNLSESYLTALKHQECYDGLVKSYNLDKDIFSSYDVYSLKCSRDDKDKDEDPSTGSDRGLKKRKTSKDVEPTTSPKTKDSSSRSSKGTKAQPKSFGKCIHAKELEFEVRDTDTPQGQEGNQGNDNVKPRTESASRCIKDMVPNIWSLVKVAYDKYALWVISHWRDQCKTFYAYARGIQSRGDVYSTKRILAVTHVSGMRKHRYVYLEEIVNWLINLSRDDVGDFTIALRMFTRSLVIQKRVEDLQLGVKSYQKQIIVTKPDTTRLDLRKRHPYTPYKTLKDSFMSTTTRGIDITKIIDMEYFPKRRWSTLEKKRAYCMIKDINKLLKEKRMMRSLEKYLSGRLYRTDLRLLQRTI